MFIIITKTSNNQNNAWIRIRSNCLLKLESCLRLAVRSVQLENFGIRNLAKVFLLLGGLAPWFHGRNRAFETWWTMIRFPSTITFGKNLKKLSAGKQFFFQSYWTKYYQLLIRDKQRYQRDLPLFGEFSYRFEHIENKMLSMKIIFSAKACDIHNQRPFFGF